MRAATGAAYEGVIDITMPSTGPMWAQRRTHSSLLDSTSNDNETAQGWLWRNDMMMEFVSSNSVSYEDADATIIIDAHRDLTFTNTATDTWTTDDFEDFTLTHDTGNKDLILEADSGERWYFHDLDVNTSGEQGLFYKLEDGYSNGFTLTHNSNGDVTRVDDADGHRMVYTYLSSGDNSGKLQTIKLYKAAAETNANLIGQVDYAYYSSTDANTNGGQNGDLQLVTVKTRATSDADGTLSIIRQVHYRYWEGLYNPSTNRGTDHKLKYIVRPENFQRLMDTSTNGEYYKIASDATVFDYANAYFEYDSNYRVSEIQERNASCGCGGSGTSAGTTGFAWTVNGSTPSDYKTWALHGVVDRPDDTRIIFDMNKDEKVLTWVFQDEDDGSPNQEWIWRYDFTSHNRLERTVNPSGNTAYDESAPYGVTSSSSVGLVQKFGYFNSGNNEDYLETELIMQGTNGTAITVAEYERSVTNRPDLVTSKEVFEQDTDTNGPTTTFNYTFHDADSRGVKEITTTMPVVSTGRNGPGDSYPSEMKQFFDGNGRLRWERDGEGYVTYYGYDDGASGTGRRNLTVRDAATASLAASIDSDWDGTEFGLGSDDAVPFSRTGSGSALDLETTVTIDFLGRVRKTTDAEGMITWFVYSDDQKRIYPTWDAAGLSTNLPVRITLLDKENRSEEAITLKTSASINTNGSDEPDGTEALSQGDYATWSVNEYNSAGQMIATKRYHNIPSSGDGTRFSNYYQTEFEYDTMGRQEYVIADVADDSPNDVEQVNQNIYDVLGRVIETKRGVSGSGHNIASGMPTLNEAQQFVYDDGGVGDGNVTASKTATVKSGIPQTMQFRTTEFEYDWRNRRVITKPPLAPYTLVKYDNLNRVTASGSFSSTNGLDPGDDPADSGLNTNRISLSKTYFDEVGRIYKTERFMDPSDSTPADALTTNTYFDRRGMVWASDAANTGIQFSQFDGAGRRTASFSGTQFDSGKYSSGAPDYPDDNEGIVEYTSFEMDDVGNVTKTVRKELNHNDSNGMDLDGTDFIRTYVYNWYDDAHRMTDTANYGTNNASGWKDNSTAPTYGASAPARSDTILVTSYAFDSAGRRVTVTDPKANVTSNAFDDLGRNIAKIEDDGGLDRKTEYQYNGQGSLVRIIHDPDADNTFANGTWTFAGSDVDQMTEYDYGSSTDAGWVTKILYPSGDGAAADTSDNRIVFDYRFDGAVSDRTDQNGTKLRYTYDDLGRKSEEDTFPIGSGVETDVRSVTWQYDANGRLQFVTTHSDNTPDTSSYTDAVTQIKNTYDDAGYLTEQEQEFDGAVDGSTKSVQLTYETDFTSSGNHKRISYLTYPDGTKIWRGYTGGSFHDTINDEFSRVGYFAFDDGGSIGDAFASYSFNGMRRMVQRAHDNNSLLDYWHQNESPGHYEGLDRFGRPSEMIVWDTFSFADLDDRVYTYDRNGNPLTIENQIHKFRSMELTYDDLNRLTQADEGYLVSGALEKTDLSRGYNMDLLGNLVDGFDQNGVADAFLHAVNASNEITELTRGNPAGQARVFVDEFPSLSSLWSQEAGTWSVSSGRLQVDSVPTAPDPAEIIGPTFLDNGTVSTEFEIPSGGGNFMLEFARTAPDEVWVVQFGAGGMDVLQSTPGNLYAIKKLYFGGGSVSNETKYIARITRNQRHIDYAVLNTNGTVVMSDSYDSTDDFGEGYFGLATGTVGMKFDDFGFTRLDQVNPVVPKWSGTGKASLASATLNVQSRSWGGESILEWAGDDDYIAQADIDLNSGEDARLIVRYQNPDNYYAVEIGEDAGGGSGPIALVKRLKGKESTVSSTTYVTSNSVTLKVLASGSTIKAWLDGTLEINTNGGDLAAGGVALAGDTPKFDNVKVGYDNNADDDIDDGGDDLVINDAFDATTVGFTYDDNGNLTDDGTYKYTYDAWNRLVKVTVSSDTDIVIQTARFDGLGRRVRKVVTNSGDLDGTTVYYHNGNQIIETRDGSGDLVQQMYHGTQYIDELVGLRIADLGRLYVHQDANYNVVALSDMSGRFVERTYYSPYGQPEFVLDAHPFDYDDDGDVDAADIAAATTGGDCWGSYTGQDGDCKRLDADADRDIDADDHTTIVNYVNALPTDADLQRVPSSPSSMLGNAFAHQGLVLDPEIGSYQNRARQYAPPIRRFAQKDPLARSNDAGSGFQDGLNLYASLDNNPPIRLDPMGLGTCCNSSSEPIRVRHEDGCDDVPCDDGGWISLPPDNCVACDGAKGSDIGAPASCEIHKITDGCSGYYSGSSVRVRCSGAIAELIYFCRGGCQKKWW